MSSSATLALGQASYTLLDVLNDDDAKVASLSKRGSTETLSAVKRGGEISDIGILGDGSTTLNVTDRSSGLFYAENHTSNSTVDSKINLLAGSFDSTFELGNGDNRLNSARDLTYSEVTAHEGDDTIRIGGSADGTSVSTGAGDDQFTANRGSVGLDVAMGEGDDTALFLGTLTAGLNLVTPFDINYGRNIIDMGAGNDSATFLGGVQGGEPGSTGYEIQLGAGYDTVVFGASSRSDGFVLNTGTGSDMVTLGRTTTNAVIDLGWDSGGDGDHQNTDLFYEQGDLVVLGIGASLADSLIRSGQSEDALLLAGTVTDTTLDLGLGNAEVDVFGAVVFSDDTDAFWDLGGGNDSLTFREYSDISLLGNESYGYFDLGTGADSLSLLGTGFGEWGAIEFDLGDDNDIDTIEFGLDSAYSGLLINNFGDEDILIIGDSEYGYEDLFEFGVDDDLSTFLAAGNEIRNVYGDSLF